MSTTTVRHFQIVRCTRCSHIWDHEDPEAEVCPCIDMYGDRTVEVISEGSTNTPYRVAVFLSDV